MKTDSKKKIFGVIGLICIVGSALSYVYGHKPFTPENLLGVLRAIYQLGIAFGVMTLAAGLGERLLRRWQACGLERMVVTLGIGVGVLSLILLTLGVTIGYSVWINAVLSLSALILLRHDVMRWLSGWNEVEVNEGFEKAIALCAGVIVFCAILTTLAPPLKFDALVYHLTLPRIYLNAGRMIYLPELMFWGMPQFTEMLYLLAMQFGGVESAAALGALVGITALGGVFGITKHYFGPKAAWMAVAALLAGETLSESLSWGYNEWASILIGTGALVTLVRWMKDNEQMDLWITGALAGFALSIKYTNGIFLLCILLVLFLSNGKILKQRFVNMALLGVLATLVSSPWWIKNALTTGNPFYPLLFESGAMDATRIMLYRNSIPWGNWLTALLLPIQATVYGIEGAEGFSASIGPILLAFSCIAWIDWKKRTSEQQIALRAGWIITLGGMILWAVASRFSSLLIQSRLYFVIFPAWALLAGTGLDAIWYFNAGTVRLGRMAGLLAIFMLGLNVFQTMTAFTARNPLGLIFGFESQESYVTRNLGTYSITMKMLDKLAKDSHVLMLWEPRGYYCIPYCDSDEVIDRWVTDFRRDGSPEAVLKDWNTQGYTHALVFEYGAQFVKDHDTRVYPEEWLALDKLLDLMQVQDHIGVYTLYKIR